MHEVTNDTTLNPQTMTEVIKAIADITQELADDIDTLQQDVSFTRMRTNIQTLAENRPTHSTQNTLSALLQVAATHVAWPHFSVLRTIAQVAHDIDQNVQTLPLPPIPQNPSGSAAQRLIQLSQEASRRRPVETHQTRKKDQSKNVKQTRQ